MSAEAAGEKVKLLGMRMSAPCARVSIALKEKGVAYEYEEEDLSNKSPLLLSSNPVHAKVPVLLHNGRPVCESVIIVQYIDEAWPGSCSFLPHDAHARATARFWTDFIDTKLSDATVRLVKSVDMEAVEQAKEDLTERLITLESAFNLVAHGKPYFGGESIGLVDITLGPFVSWFSALEEVGNFKLPNKQQCPCLHAWMERMAEHPSVKETLPPPHKLVERIKIIKQREP